ncbi:SDR family NAD(P)-dependent oxidoreductase [Aeromicrobium sp. CTD01-1L150]|uniref:SDR family NAD(P)-dependent oxidoreductase n=1 Tax=Aeromicrobium sp. CTD01-1L150 TaxID=3341830 RepID=UPI0035BF2BE6
MESETVVGNGRAIAITLARHGARLALVDRDEESLKGTAEIVRSEGSECVEIVADISSEDACARIASESLQALGHIDVLCNNVGIGDGDSSIGKLDVEAWDRIHRVNLRGMTLTCKHVLPSMIERRTGSIVSISSIAAEATTPLIAYSTAKAGVNALSKSIASTHARFGIRSNVVMPGLIHTPLGVGSVQRKLGLPVDEIVEGRNQRVPLGHQMGTGWDVANAVLFFASPESRFVSGAVLPVDGAQITQVGVGVYGS